MALFPSNWAYVGLIVLGVIEFFWLQVAGHTVLWSTLKGPMISTFILFAAVVTTRIGYCYPIKGRILFDSLALQKWKLRMMATYEGLLFITIGWIVLRLFNHLTMTVAFPYADEQLITMSNLVPVNWNRYFEFVAGNPILVVLLDKAYTGLSILTIVAFMGLILLNRVEAARFYAVSFTLTAIYCTIIGMFFPAKAAVAVVLENTQLLSNFPYEPGTYSVPILEALRSGMPISFDMRELPGLTTFPSFHTAAGIVMVYAYRGTALYWAVFGYTVVMIASTPIYGGHYFIDLIAGSAVALAICRLVELRPVFKGFLSAPQSSGQSAANVAHPAQ